ncbi:MAG: immunoglobulin domain-containing protein, partial [Verrucomicrobia bacterium]|nr:immunoglobulin domain-containing protein [Verrucomicrobiota bacterium]
FGHVTVARRLGIILAGLLLSSNTARAAVILYDSFSYPSGSLITNSTFFWKAHSGTTGQTQVVSGRVQLSQNHSEDVAAGLTNGPYSGDTLYASFTINFSALPSGAGNYFAHFKDSGSANFRAKVFATTSGAVPGFFRVGVANVANTPLAIPTDLALGGNYTLVVRYTVAPPATTLWINPAGEDSLTDRADATDSATALAITTFALRQSNSGGGMGVLTLDDLIVATSFAEANPPAASLPPTITEPPQDQTVAEGSTAIFTVTATGTPPLGYQWQFNGDALPSETTARLALDKVVPAQAGDYTVTVTNLHGATSSAPASLTVTPPLVAGFSLVTYNTHGALVEDWSTNSPQVQAIGRQLQYLQPDIVTFQEIPFTNTWQMPGLVAAYLPGYELATNSGTDGFIRSVIASRFPITRSTKWLDGVSLVNFGYNGNFTRDLFEAQIAVPGFPQPLHVFTTHLKAGQGTDDSARRAAEAKAISNFFVTGFLTTNQLRPYLLTGDLNEDIARPPASQPLTVQSLTSVPTGLHLTTPINPLTGEDLTFSIRAANLTRRYDYILPCGLLFSNVADAQVFRSDKLTEPSPLLVAGDSATASDHLPVMMVFNHPYDKPFRLLSATLADEAFTLTWESVPGQPYQVESSSNLSAWIVVASNLVPAGSLYSFSTNLGGQPHFFRVYRVP